MPSVTITLPVETKLELKRFVWVNWSEVARQSFLEAVKKQKALQKLEETFKNSELTDKDCLRLGRKLKEDVWQKYRERGW